MRERTSPGWTTQVRSVPAGGGGTTDEGGVCAGGVLGVVGVAPEDDRGRRGDPGAEEGREVRAAGAEAFDDLRGVAGEDGAGEVA